MATATGTYATKADLKTRLSITDTTDDGLLQQCCDWANQTIEGYTGRVLAPIAGSQVYTYDGRDAIENGRCLLIPRGVRTVTQLRTAFFTGGAWNVIPATDYFLQPNAQERQPGFPATELWMTDIPSSSNPAPTFSYGMQNVEVTGTFGWPAIPDDVPNVALNIAVKLWRGRGSGGNSDAFKTGADGERTFTWLLSLEDRQVLDRYRLRVPSVL